MLRTIYEIYKKKKAYKNTHVFQNTDYALLVVLPNEKDTTLKEVMDKLAQMTFENLLEATSMVPAFVTMPCFQSNNITYMKTVMQQVTI